MMLPSVCVATLRGCTARPASRLRWCRPTTGVAVDGVPSPAGANLRSSAPTQRSGRKPGVVEAVAHDAPVVPDRGNRSADLDVDGEGCLNAHRQLSAIT